jgi:hypothetical protein
MPPAPSDPGTATSPPAETRPAPSAPPGPSAPPAIAPEPGRDIVVVPLADGGLEGVRATYHVRATLERAKEVLLDFDRHAEFRPSVLGSEITSREADGGTVRLTFVGLLGVNPTVECRVRVEEAAGRLRIGFERIAGSFMVSRLEGFFDLEEGPPGSVRIVQEYRIAAIRTDPAMMLENHARDARAIRDRIEAAASATGPAGAELQERRQE